MNFNTLPDFLFKPLKTIVRDNLQEIDHLGHFEADDEVGTTFKLIKETVDELQELQGEEVDAA